MTRHDKQESLIHPIFPTVRHSYQRATCWVLAAGILIAQCLPVSMAQILDTSGRKPVHGQVSISRDVNIAVKNDKVSLNLRDAALRDVLNTLAAQGNFNIIMDDSVEGTLTIDVKDIPINKALEYIFTVSQLSYTKDGNTVIIASREQADAKNLNAKTLKAIPVQYKDAANIAKQLNDTVFKVARPGGSTSAVASSDPNSNSLLIMGTDTDIKLVADMLRELDVPRNRKVYSIKHNTPGYVASVLSANFFQNMGTGGSASSGSSSASSSSSSSGASSGGSSSGSSGGGSSSGSSSGGSSGSSGGSSGGASSGLSTFSSGGVTFISEPVSATLTVLATDEQLSLIDSIIEQVDVKRPQVEIEVALVEIQNSEIKSFKPLWGGLNLGKEASLNLNVLDTDGNPTGINVFSFAKSNITGSRPGSLVSSLDVRQNHQSVKGKILANPTIVAMDGQKSTITITDQIPNITQSVTTPTVGPPVTVTSITTQEAGVTLNMTPSISNDGSVVLTLNPEVSQPSRVITAGNVSTTLISKRTLNLSGVRVQDGQTLVIGGLLRESNRIDINRVPGLDKLPIVSAMFRTINNNDKDRTELVLMVTPHILRENAVSYFSHPTSHNPNLPTNKVENIQPVSLPKFIGPTSLQNEGNPLTPMPSGEKKTALPRKNLQASSNGATTKPHSNDALAIQLRGPAQEVMPTTTEQFGIQNKNGNMPHPNPQGASQHSLPIGKNPNRHPSLEALEELLQE